MLEMDGSYCLVKSLEALSPAFSSVPVLSSLSKLTESSYSEVPHPLLACITISGKAPLVVKHPSGACLPLDLSPLC